MADVIITLQIMPTSPEEDLDRLQEESKNIISNFEGEVGKIEISPVAFGLNALKLFFVLDENKCSIDELVEKVSEVKGVKSAEIVDVRRAIG